MSVDCILAERTFATGYPYVYKNSAPHYGHRLVLEEKLGRCLEPGELATHSCDTRACVNPEHIHLGTKRSNAMEALERHPTYKASLRKTEEQRKHHSLLTSAQMASRTLSQIEAMKDHGSKASRRFWNTATEEQREQHRERSRAAAFLREAKKRG